MRRMAPAPRNAFDRFTDWVLDRDGDVYGIDERERLEWYEGIALGASVQVFAVLWALAVLVWFAAASAAHMLLAVFAVAVLPLILTNVHMGRHNVEVDPARWSPKRIGATIAYGLPFPVFLGGYIRATDVSILQSPGEVVRDLLGMLVVFGVFLLFGHWRLRRRRAVGDDDLD